MYPVGVTFGLIGMITSIGVGYRLAEKYRVDALPVISGIIYVSNTIHN